jgi:hypothetical protein
MGGRITLREHPIRVEKETHMGEERVLVRLPSGAGAIITPAQARELYARLEWVI